MQDVAAAADSRQLGIVRRGITNYLCRLLRRLAAQKKPTIVTFKQGCRNTSKKITMKIQYLSLFLFKLTSSQVSLWNVQMYVRIPRLNVNYWFSTESFRFRFILINGAISNFEMLIKSEIEFLIYILLIRCQPKRHLRDGWSGCCEMSFLKGNRDLVREITMTNKNIISINTG